MPRGRPRKVIEPLAADQALPAEAPAELDLNPEESRAYRALASLLLPQGTARAADVPAVAMTARTQVHLRRLEKAVSGLKQLTIDSPHGSRIHPLVTELRATRMQLSALLAALLLSPRARSASRLPAAAKKDAAVPSRDEFSVFLGAP